MLDGREERRAGGRRSWRRRQHGRRDEAVEKEDGGEVGRGRERSREAVSGERREARREAGGMGRVE